MKQSCWALFGEARRTGLIPLDRNPNSARGGVDSRVIEMLYRAALPDFVQDGNIFMHDNAPVHTAAIVKPLLEE